MDRATQHRSQDSKGIPAKEFGNDKNGILSCGSPEFNAVEECWRQGKHNILSNYYSYSLSHLKEVISQYYRTRRFNLDIKKVSA